MTGRCPNPNPSRDEATFNITPELQVELSHACGWAVTYAPVGSVPARIESDMAEHFGPLEAECGAATWQGNDLLICVRRPAEHIGEHVTRHGRSFLLRGAAARPPTPQPTHNLARGVQA